MHTSTMDKCKRKRIGISRLASGEKKSRTVTTTAQEILTITPEEPSKGHAQADHSGNTSVPKRLLVRRSTARPLSYAAAASDTASPSPSTAQFPTTTTTTTTAQGLRPRSTPQSASLQLIHPPISIPLPPSPPPPPPPPPPTSPLPRLLQVEKVPRTTQAPSFFKLGMIIEAPLMEEDFMYGASLLHHRSAATAAASDRFSISASHYGYIHTKLRKFVIVALFARHYVAVPMYSHNGEGLEKKLDRSEFVSVRDARSGTGVVAGGGGGGGRGGGGALVEGLSDHRVLVAEMRPEALRLYEKTTVHFAYPFSRGYGLRVLYLGELERGSRQRLLGLFREYMINGTVDFE